MCDGVLHPAPGDLPNSVAGVATSSRPAFVSDDVMLARAYLSRVAEPACLPLWAAVREHGPVPIAAAIRSGEAGAELTTLCGPRATAADPHADLAAAQRHGIRLVIPEDDAWPHFAFACLVADSVRSWARRSRSRDGGPRVDGTRDTAARGELVPPLALWVRGRDIDELLPRLAIRSVGVVGARAASAYGEHVTAELVGGLVQRDFVIVSGGAFGIDAAAHRAAFALGGTSVLVSAGGLDQPYPAANGGLFTEAARTGLVVSESPPGCAPQRRRFLTRNRLIAAMSTGTVVVEAAARSGALNTAGYADRLGRPVMAVPGPVTSALSLGCHNLIRKEQAPAILVCAASDVAAVIGSPGETDTAAPSGSGSARWLQGRLDQLTPVERDVFDAVPARRPLGTDALVVHAGLPVADVIAALSVLESLDLVENIAGSFRISRQAAKRGASP